MICEPGKGGMLSDAVLAVELKCADNRLYRPAVRDTPISTSNEKPPEPAHA
jgi:hypothetical protein